MSALAGLSAGCSTPTPPATTAPAPETPVRYIGDRLTVSLQEIIASVAVEGAGQPYQNLHVELAAVINPLKTETNTSQTYSSVKVEDFIRRLGPKISSEVLKTLCEGRTLSPKTMGAIRSIILSRAQDVVSQALTDWRYAADYSVEILITTMYLTDPSVGKTGPLRGW
jgi:hypothetical protein